jgi:hypothetical protein
VASGISLTSSKKSVPVAGQVEAAQLAAVGAGEGALLVSEQLALHQGLRQGPAVYRHEGLVAARAGGVDLARDQLLAGAAFAVDQHGGVGRLGRLLGVLQGLPEGGGAADDPVHRELARHFALQYLHPQAQGAGLQGARNGAADFVHVERLGHEIHAPDLMDSTTGFTLVEALTMTHASSGYISCASFSRVSPSLSGIITSSSMRSNRWSDSSLWAPVRCRRWPRGSPSRRSCAAIRGCPLHHPQSAVAS